MMMISKFLATASPLDLLPLAQAPEKNSAISSNAAIIAFAALIVILLVITWAIFIRKPERSIVRTPEEAAASVSGKGRRRKMTNRFPTLAETGGLPPIKARD